MVTGAGGGIGAATAQMLSTAGAAVLCADLDRRALPTASLIEKNGGRATQWATDVAKRGDVEAAVKAAIDTFGRLDIMVNNAGIIINQTVADTVDADFDHIFDVNVKGVFYGCRAAARVMALQGSGTIVNLSSGAIDMPVPNTVAYSMTKAAVAQLTRNLAMEVGPSGVRVNAVAPGLVLSPMTSRHFTRPDGSIDEAKKAETIVQFTKAAPTSLVGTPSDIAHCILFLASDASRYMTGQILRPNGGIAMPW